MRHSVIAMFALVLVLAANPGIRPAAAGVTTRQKQELQRIKREMREKRKKIRSANKKEHSILADLDRIDRDLQKEKAGLAAKQEQLKKAEAGLRDVEKDSARTGRNLDRLKRLYGMRVRALYKMHRSGGSIAAILASDDLDDAMKRMEYLALIAEQDQSLMRSYADALDDLNARRAVIAEKRESILESKRTVEAKNKEYQSLKRKKAVLLARVRGKRELYEDALQELEQSSANLWAMIQKTEREQRAEEETVHGSAPSGRGRLPWPAEGKILSRFGPQRYRKYKIMVYHRGIEIAVPEGGPVRAVDNGKVAFADWYQGFGKLVIIEHSPGFYTLYGNLSKLDVAKDDEVLQGQVLGLAGDTGGLGGPKLYFEIRRNGKAQDPLAWLAKR